MKLIGDVFEVFRTARDEKVRYLERVPIFEACSLRQLRAVADISKVVEVPERTVLTRQGEAATSSSSSSTAPRWSRSRCTSAIGSGPASSSAR